jgi:hypothetical protein
MVAGSCWLPGLERSRPRCDRDSAGTARHFGGSLQLRIPSFDDPEEQQVWQSALKEAGSDPVGYFCRTAPVA